MQERTVAAMAAVLLLLGTAASPCSAEETTTKTAVSVEKACRTAASAQAGVSYDHCVSTLASEARGRDAADMQQRLAVAAARMAADHAAATGARMEGLGEAEEPARAARGCGTAWISTAAPPTSSARACTGGRRSGWRRRWAPPRAARTPGRARKPHPSPHTDREYGRLALLALGLTTAIVA
ncbi:hypothetical protein HU200_004276 [Digitaria exilis]|uniref:Pectinesterase inhibitor domain-containing protein n=1 Tax=Digitaria exilis TaxID=1010633 RepID=A0A835FTX8_9POAL|nr:hypothetical protein HU200_004276 [Digitaria exilis]